MSQTRERTYGLDNCVSLVNSTKWLGFTTMQDASRAPLQRVGARERCVGGPPWCGWLRMAGDSICPHLPCSEGETGNARTYAPESTGRRAKQRYRRHISAVLHPGPLANGVLYYRL